MDVAAVLAFIPVPLENCIPVGNIWIVQCVRDPPRPLVQSYWNDIFRRTIDQSHVITSLFLSPMVSDATVVGEAAGIILRNHRVLGFSIIVPRSSRKGYRRVFGRPRTPV